jgi:uncharacterized protein (DUF3084 family)
MIEPAHLLTTRKGPWPQEDDEYLARFTITSLAQGMGYNEIFEKVARKLGRTEERVAFRWWNKVSMNAQQLAGGQQAPADPLASQETKTETPVASSAPDQEATTETSVSDVIKLLRNIEKEMQQRDQRIQKMDGINRQANKQVGDMMKQIKDLEEQLASNVSSSTLQSEVDRLTKELAQANAEWRSICEGQQSEINMLIGKYNNLCDVYNKVALAMGSKQFEKHNNQSSFVMHQNGYLERKD